MSALHRGTHRFWIWWIVCATIVASFAGCASDETLTVLDPRGQPSGIFGRVGAAGAGMMANRNPDTQPTLSLDALVPLRMAPRLESLENKTIYLIDTGFAGGTEFLEEVQLWFRENMPSVKTVVQLKSGNAFVDSPELWPELKKKADGVVFGVGG
jgi:hypothetical protein